MITRTQYLKQKRLHIRKSQHQNDKRMNRYNKFIVMNLANGKQTTAITLSKGRIAIGDDVWRMSNRSDTCEYPFKIIDQYEFNMFYKKIEPINYPLPYLEEAI